MATWEIFRELLIKSAVLLAVGEILTKLYQARNVQRNETKNNNINIISYLEGVEKKMESYEMGVGGGGNLSTSCLFFSPLSRVLHRLWRRRPVKGNALWINDVKLKFLSPG